MKNIAFLIGVSEYTREQPLPACKPDVIRIHKLLESTGKYSQIVSVSEETTANALKDLLRDFFSKYKGESIEEAFFYFSGHGSYNAILDDVLLCCTDFDGAKPG